MSVKSWATLTLKSLDDENRIITGIASTPSTDRMGDIVESKGAKFKLPFPLLSQHDHHSPIGEVFSANVTGKGIEISARVPKDTGLDYVETAWKQIKARLVRGLSIGFMPIKAVPVDADKPWKGMHYKEWEMFELSAVTIPANAECSILSVKNFDLAAAVADGSNTVQPDANTSIQRAKAAILAAKRATRR